MEGKKERKCSILNAIHRFFADSFNKKNALSIFTSLIMFVID